MPNFGRKKLFLTYMLALQHCKQLTFSSIFVSLTNDCVLQDSLSIRICVNGYQFMYQK